MAKTKPSLFSTLQKTAVISSEVNGELIRKIPVDKLLDNPLNRFSMQEDEAFQRSLQSIEKDGLWEDIIVTPAENGYYRIISGHRRKRIAQKIGLTTLPCKVRTYQTELEEARALIGENIHRRSITPLDMAYQLDTLCQVLDRAGMPNSVHERVQQLMEQTGLSRATILRYLDLLRLNQTIVSWINQGLLPMTDAYFLAQRNNCILQDRMVQEVEKMGTEIPLEKRIQMALGLVKKIKKENKQRSDNQDLNPKVNIVRTVRKCRSSIHNIHTQLTELCNLSESDLSKEQDKKALKSDIDELALELTTLLNTCNTLRETIHEKNLT